MTQQSEWEPKLLGFLCKWCSYAGADLAGTSRKKYPANIRIIKVPCSGRVDPLFILKALRLGFDGVLVGEGEKSFPELVNAVKEKIPLDMADIPGLIWKKDESYVEVEPGPPINLDDHSSFSIMIA